MVKHHDGERTMANVLRCSEVIRRTGLSRTTIWRRERAGDFPRRLILGPNAMGWIEDEVEQWIAARPRVASNQLRDRGEPAGPYSFSERGPSIEERVRTSTSDLGKDQE